MKNPLVARRLPALLYVLTALLLASPPLRAQQEAVRPWEDWNRVLSLRPGRKITVKPLKGAGKKVKGFYVSADSRTITLRTKQGQSVTVAKEKVRQVTARRARLRHATWIGLASGFALGYLLTAGVNDFDQPEAAIGFGAMGAGLGFLGGLGVRGLAQNALIYQAPKKPRSQPKAGPARGSRQQSNEPHRGG